MLSIKILIILNLFHEYKLLWALLSYIFVIIKQMLCMFVLDKNISQVYKIYSTMSEVWYRRIFTDFCGSQVEESFLFNHQIQIE